MYHNEGLKSFYISMLWRLFNKRAHHDGNCKVGSEVCHNGESIIWTKKSY